jgi:HEAT repeat protein
MGLAGGKPNIQRLEAKRDISRLVKVISYKGDRQVQDDGAQALGRRNDPRSVAPLIAIVTARVPSWTKTNYLVPWDAELAAAALAQIGDERAIGPMIALRKACGSGVDYDSNAGDPEMIPTVTALDKAIARFQVAAVAPLAEAIRNPRTQDWCRPGLAAILARIGTPQAVEELIVLTDEFPENSNVLLACILTNSE